MAALDDDLLATSHKELSKQYPDLKFVKLGYVPAGISVCIYAYMCVHQLRG